MLKADHTRLRKLLRELADTTDRAVKGRTELVRQIERELKTHAQLEEELFYPTFKKVAEDTDAEELFFEATEEHHVVDMVLPTLKACNPKSPEFAAKAKVLKELIEHQFRLVKIDKKPPAPAAVRRRMNLAVESADIKPVLIPGIDCNYPHIASGGTDDLPVAESFRECSRIAVTGKRRKKAQVEYKDCQTDRNGKSFHDLKHMH